MSEKWNKAPMPVYISNISSRSEQREFFILQIDKQKAAIYLTGILLYYQGFPCGSAGKESACNAGDMGSIPGLERSLEKGKATHSSILA